MQGDGYRIMGHRTLRRPQNDGAVRFLSRFCCRTDRRWCRRRMQYNPVVGVGDGTLGRASKGLQPVRGERVTGIGSHRPGIVSPRRKRISLRLRDLSKPVPGILRLAALSRQRGLIVALRVHHPILPAIDIGAVIERRCQTFAFQRDNGTIVLGRLVQTPEPVAQKATLQQGLRAFLGRKRTGIQARR